MKNYYIDGWISPLKQSVESLYQKLPAINVAESIANVDLDTIETNLITTQNIVADLRKLIEDHQFKTEKEEITFFKQIKPLFSGSLIYWERLLQLYLKKPIGGVNSLKKYYKSKLKNLKIFYDSHAGLYEYQRGNSDYLDNMYFLRSSRKFEDSAYSIDLNPKFTTVKDRLVGEIYANDLEEQYIHKLLEAPANKSVNSENGFPNLKWTGSQAGLVELIYALQSGGVYNNGQVGIKELAAAFQQLFKVDLGNYYNVFNEIRLRKKNRTSLLDHLKERVIQKMNTMDEK